MTAYPDFFVGREELADLFACPSIPMQIGGQLGSEDISLGSAFSYQVMTCPELNVVKT